MQKYMRRLVRCGFKPYDASRAGRYGYAMDGDMIEELRDLMNDAPDERTKKNSRS